jgi:hypothetical protein
MAIEVLLTGTTVSQAKRYRAKDGMHTKVTLEARDNKFDRINVVCITGNDRLAGSLELLEMGQAASVRGHAAIPHSEPGRGRQPHITVYLTDLIILG